MIWDLTLVWLVLRVQAPPPHPFQLNNRIWRLVEVERSSFQVSCQLSPPQPIHRACSSPGHQHSCPWGSVACQCARSKGWPDVHPSSDMPSPVGFILLLWHQKSLLMPHGPSGFPMSKTRAFVPGLKPILAAKRRVCFPF